MLKLAEARRGFFDRPGVVAAVGRAKAAAFSRAGSFVWKRARRSIKPRKKPAPPGKPPSSHVGTLRNLYYFAFDFRAESVVIGPAKVGKGNVPQTLEYGGPATVTEYRLSGGRWVRGGNPLIRGKKAGRPTRDRRSFVAARPSANPALQAELPTIAAQFRDSLRA